MSFSKRTGIILAIIFFLSLAANMFVIGWGVFHVRQFHDIVHSEKSLNARLDRGEAYILRQLDAADRAVARDIFALRRPALENALNGMRKTRRDIRALIHDTQRDVVEIVPLLARSQRHVGALNDNAHHLLRDLVNNISAEGRAKLIDKFHAHRHD